MVQENKARAIQLPITDVVMPGMSGRELRYHLLTLRPGTNTPLPNSALCQKKSYIDDGTIDLNTILI